jgi:hypothetical protein
MKATTAQVPACRCPIWRESGTIPQGRIPSVPKKNTQVITVSAS